jgi:hypothetical protein
MRRLLVPHSYIGSNVSRNPCTEASVVHVAATLAEAYDEYDNQAEALSRYNDGDEPLLFVTDELRRPIERPRLSVN